MAGGMSTSMNLPPELLELMGAFSAASKEVNKEIRSIEREAREAAKAGKELTGTKRARLDALYDKQVDLKQKHKDQRQQERQLGKSLSGQVNSLHGRAMSIASASPVGLARMGGGFLFEVAGRRAIEKVAATNIGRKIAGSAVALTPGSALAKASTFAKGFIASPAGIAAGAIAGTAIGAYALANEAIKAERREILGGIESEQAVQNVLLQDQIGTKYSADFFERSLAKMEQRNDNPIHSTVRNAFRWNPIERTRQAFGLSSSSDVADLDTKLKKQIFKIDVFQHKYGKNPELESQNIRNNPLFVRERNRKLFGSYELEPSSWFAIHPRNVYTQFRNLVSGGSYQASEEIKLEMETQDKLLAAKDTEEKRIRRSAQNDQESRKNQIQANIYFNAINVQQYESGLQWNKF